MFHSAVKADPDFDDDREDSKLQAIKPIWQQPTPTPSIDSARPTKALSQTTKQAKREEQLKSDVEELKALTVHFINAINNRDWMDGPEDSSHVALGFKAEYQQVGSLTMSQHTDIYRSLARDFPEYHVELLTCNPEVDVDAGKAMVFMDLQITGAPPGVVRNSVTVTEWKIIAPGRKWTCFRMSTIRGRDLDGQVSMY